MFSAHEWSLPFFHHFEVGKMRLNHFGDIFLQISENISSLLLQIKYILFRINIFRSTFCKESDLSIRI